MAAKTKTKTKTRTNPPLFAVEYQAMRRDKSHYPIGEPVTVAKFYHKGEAVFYAQAAFAEFPGPNPDHYRRYSVTKGNKTLYVAG